MLRQSLLTCGADWRANGVCVCLCACRCMCMDMWGGFTAWYEGLSFSLGKIRVNVVNWSWWWYLVMSPSLLPFIHHSLTLLQCGFFRSSSVSLPSSLSFSVSPSLFVSVSLFMPAGPRLSLCHYVQCPCNRDINGLWAGGPDSYTINLC